MTPDVFAAHLLAALPLAVVVGLRLAGRPLVWAVVGLLAAAGGWVGWELAGELFDGLFGRAAARTGLLALVFVPWATAVAGFMRPTARPRPNWVAGLVAVVAAAALPALAADRAVTAAVAEARRLLVRGRLAASAQAVDRAFVLTADRTLPLDGKPVPLRRVRGELAREVARLTAEADRPLPAGASLADRYDRAGALLALGRPAEVEPLLRDQVAGSPRSRLRLAEALADLRDWPAAADQCRAAAGAVRPFADRDPKAAAVQRQALDGLTDALAEQDDRAGVEAVLRDGADTLPAFAGHFRLRLGDFYRTTGRPLAALSELREAARIDPSLAAAAGRMEQAIREATPGCLVGR